MVPLLEGLLREVPARPRHLGRDHAPARPRAGGAFALFQRDDGHRIPLPVRLGRALGRGRPHGFRPEGAPDDLRQEHGIPQPDHGREDHSVCHRAVPRRGSRGAGLPLRGLRGAGAGGRRHPRRHALPSGARAVQVRRAAAAKEQVRREGRRNP